MFISLKNKVLQFWRAFSEEEATIREMIDNNADGKTILSFSESILKIAFNEVEFQLGVNIDGKYELILSPQGDRIKLIQYHYWLRYAPEHLKNKWVFYSSKPAFANTEYKLNMFGVAIEDKDLILYPTVNNKSSKIELKVYCPKLNDITESQKYSIIYTFLDQYISELYTIEYVSKIQFTGDKLKHSGIKISLLKEYIDVLIEAKGWSHSENPLDGYIGYKLNQTEEKEGWGLREDITSGYSSCTAAISAYHFKDEEFYHKYKQDGMVFGFIFYENFDLADSEAAYMRANIEDQIIEQTGTNGIANCIGGAAGLHFSYIDFVIYDYKAFMKIIKEIMADNMLDEVGFSYFLPGAKPIILSEVVI